MYYNFLLFHLFIYVHSTFAGTGGGLSIRQNGFIYCAPSGVQKERIRFEDIFILNEDGEILEKPNNPKLKCSECLSLFMVPFKLRQAGCCIHSHSINANLVTAFYSERNLDYLNQRDKDDDDVVDRNGGKNFHHNKSKILQHNRYNEFRISNQEMIKGIKRGSSDESLQYNDTVIVPIIDNVLFERDLTGALLEAINKYPNTNAVLVRNHGVYVWGKTWQQAKSMTECYDYLFALKLEALKCGFNWMLEE